MKPISPFGLPLGISTTFWTIIGAIRLISEKLSSRLKKKPSRAKVTKQDIAVILPAHNEELVIRKAIRALTQLLDKSQIYVVSDGSNDRTYNRARMEGCHVSCLMPGRGKARALVYLLKRYRLYERYKLIFIVDADTQMDEKSIDFALPLFEDPDIGVVFASSQIRWPKHIVPRLGLYFVAYRDRLNRMLQYFLIYGQTWKYTNVNYVIPGFATIYRSSVLKKLEIDTPGLLIEDFNLAFQFHKKKLGKIGYNPAVIGWDQYPDNLRDYWKQVRRWNIGFFQTVRKNGIWPSGFWLALGVFSIEIFLHSVFVLCLPLLILYLVTPYIAFASPVVNSFTQAYQLFGPYKYVSLWSICISVFLFDYLLTVIIGLINKKPQFLIYGLFFFVMHYITSLILLSSIIPGLFGSSSGRWVPPTRQAPS